ncbi:tyrosine-type recombinase/integrase [Lysinibacillus sphaericus]|uniref:tyrosine-type recombinase/integrase n=1 Tax=Lysinibacillus sphaericus TaxID=1421 RepID=UPI003D713BA2
MNEKMGMLIDVHPLKTKKEIHELIEALGMSQKGLRDQLLFKIGISTGLRCGDLVSWKVEQVKGKSNFKICEGKTKKERTVYLNNLMADIADYIDTLPKEAVYLFLSRKGDGHITTNKRTALSLKQVNDRKQFNWHHTMRKTVGYTYYQATRDVATLMKIFNHSSQKTTLRYIGITEESIENSIKSIHFLNYLIRNTTNTTLLYIGFIKGIIKFVCI